MMKKSFFLTFLCVIFSLVCFSNVMNVSAETKEYDYLIYKIEEEQVTIIDCDEKATGEKVVPSKIDGYPVTSIESSTFYNCEK